MHPLTTDTAAGRRVGMTCEEHPLAALISNVRKRRDMEYITERWNHSIDKSTHWEQRKIEITMSKGGNSQQVKKSEV